MRPLEPHRDVGAYALGALDEAEARRFEDHLGECPSCTAQVSEFRPAVRQLMLYRGATPRSVHPFAVPGPRLLERLLDEMSARYRTGRRRWLYAVTAVVVCAVVGPAVVGASGGGSSPAATALSAADPETGLWARLITQDRVWGSQIDVTVKGISAPHSCRLVAVGKDGSEHAVTNWMTRAAGGGATTVQGGAALRSEEIDRYEVRTGDGRHLITLKSP